ncbi:hypothetical protein [Curtobacterium sp. MCLR17_054]|uniref:hypothetical protein n=1 Tax=Curtobacterium sp. MCLR17_054 TaxID=2175632 RepID=UPI0011B644BC|nr:hypothetical protein [Curtobacterium sp. MCLR17_054]WIE69210.1 hypothetical protein DEJ08_004330 [Curtobacterium sp. MCLR17_054]
MNNRQAALIAASSLEANPIKASRTARLLSAWLDELDLAQEEQRLPITWDVLAKAVDAGADLELVQRSPIVKIRSVDDRAVVELANGRSYTWYGSWSRDS